MGRIANWLICIPKMTCQPDKKFMKNGSKSEASLHYIYQVHTLAERLLGRKSLSIVLGGGFFLFVPFLSFSSLSPKKTFNTQTGFPIVITHSWHTHKSCMISPSDLMTKTDYTTATLLVKFPCIYKT